MFLLDFAEYLKHAYIQSTYFAVIIPNISMTKDIITISIIISSGGLFGFGRNRSLGGEDELMANYIVFAIYVFASGEPAPNDLACSLL